MMTILLMFTGWTIAQAQDATPKQRINLTRVDYKSTYTTQGELNQYENTLRINQPDGPYKLTAGMLNNGDNFITFYRKDDKGNDTEFARINLNADITIPEEEFISVLSFYGDGTNLPTSDVTITSEDLPANWGTDDEGLLWQTNGSATITTSTGLTFTMPDGYSNATIQLIVYVGPNVRGGYFGHKYNDGDWYVSSQVSANSAYVIGTFAGVNSGDVIAIYGGEYSGGYYLAQSPDIDIIAVAQVPTTLIPTATVTPTISTKDGDNWGAETSLGNATTYSVNDTINLYALGNVTDIFNESTTNNDHSVYYNYAAALDANVVLPAPSSTGLDFYASINFTDATSGDFNSATFVGPNNWSYMGTNVYSPSAGTCCYIMYYGSLMYTMPESFMGDNVSVTVTTSNSTDGEGTIIVNSIPHSFSAGETYTWSVPVYANGSIEFQSIRDNEDISYTPDFTSIVISSGNGNSLNAPSQKYSTTHKSKAFIAGRPMPKAEGKREHNSMIKMND